MNFVAVLFLACIAIHSGFSSDPALNTSSLSGSIPPSEELETCPSNSSITVKVLRTLKGEWVTTFHARNKLRNVSTSLNFNVHKDILECNGEKFISISGFLIDKDADNSSEVFVGEHRNISGGEDSGKGSIDSQTNADISDRVRNTESKLVSMEDTINKLMLMMENATRYWSIESQTIAEISDRGKNTESKLVSMEDTINKLMLMMENATRYWSIESQTIAEISDRGKNTESKLVSMEDTINKLMLMMENATRYWSIESQTVAVISDRVKNTESQLVFMEETMNKLMLSMETLTQISKIEEKSNFAFDEIFKGKKIELSNDQRTASRLRPHEDYGANGGVLSNIPLRDDVAFEVRIDETIDKYRDWGITLGVIVKKDEAVKEKWNICENVPGTYCIWSLSTADKGKSHIFKDGKRIIENAYNLDTRHLPVGSTLGIVRKSDNALHFLLNGIDHGAAFVQIPDRVFAFVDVKSYVSKITIIS